MEKKTLRDNKFIDTLYRIFAGIIRYDIPALAAELTFYTVTTFFPLVILVFIIISHTSLIGEDMMWNFLNAFPHETADAIYGVLKGLTHTKTTVITAVILSMWSMSGAMNVIARALNKFYHVRENRNFFVIRIIGMLFAIFVVVSVLASFVLLVYGTLIGEALVKFFPVHIDVWNLSRMFVPLAVITLVLAIVYKTMPNRRLSFKGVIAGALFAAMCWALMSMIFSYYANNFARYHVLYGSIAGVIMLVTWLFLSSYVIIFGGYLNAGLYRMILKRRRERAQSE